MCGRTACTLAPDDIVRACSFKNRQGKRRRPVWKDAPGGQQYYPCYNVAPTAHTPVLMSSKHYPGELESFSERVVQPMKWGLVPSWHKGNPYKLEYETNNCRAEGMLTKRTYKTPLEKGNRCVVLADGFFEWKRSPQGKQPYFIYFPQKSSVTPPDTKPGASFHATQMAKPDTNSDSSSKPQVKQEPVDVKADPLRVRQEPVDVKADPLKVRQEPVDVKPDSKSTIKFTVKQEQGDTKSDSLKSDRKSAVYTQVKQEPADIKPGPDGVLESARTEGGDAASSSTDDGDWAKLHSAKEERVNDFGKEGDQGLGQHGDISQGPDQTPDAEDEEWHGKQLLTMAGVFDVWQPPDGSPPLYSYSVITVESSPAFAGIHHRMPAILSTEEEVRAWLDFAEVPLRQAAKIIRPTEVLSMHMVSSLVNNSRNKSPECVQPYNPKQVKRTASSALMMNWLSKASPSPSPSPSPGSHPPHAKKQKSA